MSILSLVSLVSCEERMNFIENLLGDNVQKHTEADSGDWPIYQSPLIQSYEIQSFVTNKFTWVCRGLPIQKTSFSLAGLDHWFLFALETTWVVSGFERRSSRRPRNVSQSRVAQWRLCRSERPDTVDMAGTLPSRLVQITNRVGVGGVSMDPRTSNHPSDF